MNIKIKSASFENFKGLTRLHVDFSDNTVIRGKNATGKSSVADGIAWCLFGKNSAGDTDFAVRPKDTYGNDIHNIDITVELVLEITDENGITLEHTLRKVSKEKWTKKRGSDAPELQGNTVEYTIDEFPKKKTEYDAFISGLIPNNVFRMITDPMYFTSLKWTEQREILMKMVSSMSFVELATMLGGFEELIPDLQVASKLDDIVRKYKAEKKKLDERVTEIPIRIDELSKMLIDVDVADLQRKKYEITAKAADTNKAQEEQQNAVNAVLRQIFDITQQMSEISNNLRLENIKATSALKNEINQLQVDINTAVGEMRYAVTSIQRKKDDLDLIEKNGTALNNEYKMWSSKTLTEKDTTCPMCGQPLPADKVAHLKEDLETKKAEMIAKVKEHAAFEKSRKENTLADIEEWQKRYQKHADMKKVCDERMIEVQKELANVPTAPAPETNAEWVELDKKCKQLKAEYAEMQSKMVNATINTGNTELERINAMLSRAKENENIKNRISELQEEQRSLAQKVLDAERMVNLADEFIRKQLDYISDQVNGKFDNVQFRLFEQQYNGGIVPVCTAQVNGVDFSDLNTGEKIAAGLRIIKTLQREFGHSSWITVDNSEALDQKHRESIEMPNQMIWLIVSNDDQLTVEA